ncbi:Bacterial Ig-like domain (group 2) [Butyrivibrio sp. ob235]|uniref:Ig-like domain-containing protein n=1 Tax=unclassified Butyrivibrio TaxID=2639466 RepID=UPI0003B510D4|nr:MULTISPECIES: hypothetical protein [unclassified Butyrivibrio]SEK34470.1 Bacterial Ig-like domain (group 2) [Butyrivibrio sp. ob235]
MNTRIKRYIFLIFLFWGFFFACPFSEKLSISLHVSAASDNKLYVGSNARYFTKTVLPNEEFKITVYDNRQKLSTKGLKFKSSKPSVATIDKNGNIVAHDLGITTIQIKRKHHLFATLTVKVKESIPRILFIGDSRSVYMFNVKNNELCGDVRNGMFVYARSGAQHDYIDEVLNEVDPDSYDVVVSWMGANDRGNFGVYRKYYNELLKMKKKLILCTVGPVKDAYLDEIGLICFTNNLMVHYNKGLKKWAKKNHVATIDLYNYIVKKNLRVDTRDGVHYLPRPTKSIWKFILKKLPNL